MRIINPLNWQVYKEVKVNDSIVESFKDLETMIDLFQGTKADIEALHEAFKTTGHHALAVHTKKALDGINGVLEFFDELHSDFEQFLEPIHIPIEGEDESNKPKLISIKGGKS
jgi:hypothetical protein